MTVHVGILGGGGISDTHARAASAIPGVEIVAVHGDNADKARRLAAAHHVPDYPTVEAFLAHRPMEVVAIGSPSGCHSAQAIAGARAGLHVLVEKPMAVTAEDAATLVDACDASGSSSRTVCSLTWSGSRPSWTRAASAGSFSSPAT
jgi:UDP-N-acetyl-2-amino-2-deoxyglucuronate dehydrogenase